MVDINSIPIQGTSDTDSDGKDVREVGAPDKYGKDQSNDIHTRVHLEKTNIGGLQQESNKLRGFFWGEEKNMGKMQGVP